MARAASDDSDDESCFSQALKCSIHLGVIKQPRALPCMHTFCRDCLEQLVSGSQIKCPICRKTRRLSAKGVDDLPNNIIVQNILDTLCVSCQKTPLRTTCPCCQQQLCDKCKLKHALNLQTKITDRKMNLSYMAELLTQARQNLDRSKTRFLSETASAQSEVNSSIMRAKELLKKRGTQLQAKLDSLISTETNRIDKCKERIQKYEQEIQVALQKPDGADTAILENLERLSEYITALLSTMPVRPAAISCKLDEQLVKNVVHIKYEPPQYDYQAIGSPKKEFGQRGSCPGQFESPTYLAVSPVSGNIVVFDAGNSRVQIFTADGEFINMFGSEGDGEGQFASGDSYLSGGVTVTDGGKIVIADMFNDRLQVFDEDGQFVRVIGAHGSAPGKFDYPAGVTCDHSDHLYICDEFNHRVQVMTMDSSVVRVMTAIEVPGKDFRPTDIAVCPDGHLVVADWETGLQIFSATGQHEATIPCGDGQEVECLGPAGVAVDPQGYIFVTDGNEGGTKKVYVVEKSGKLVSSFLGDDEEELDWPVGVAVTQDGDIIIANKGTNSVQIF